jgi:hypothetical protein
MSFRYHLLSLVAVLLALAAGVALGGGPLSELDPSAAPAAQTGDPAAVQQARAAAGFADDVLDAGAARLYAGGLAGRPVALVTFPGVPDATATAVTDQVTRAGGTLTGSYDVSPAMVEVGEKALVDTLGSQLLTQLQQQGSAAFLDATAPTYERMGELMGLALATTDAKRKATVGQVATSVVQSLAGADLMTVTGDPATRAPYVLVLLGPDSQAADDPIYSGLLTGLAAQSVGVTVAADAADGVDGRLSRLRREPVADGIATVDGIDTGSGRVTAVLALTQWPASQGGSFGASGADGPVRLR